MKEQAQLREEMAYQYKLGNFEVMKTILLCLCCSIISFFSSLSLISHITFIGRGCYSKKVGPRCCYVSLTSFNAKA